jgi:ferrous iron transport protein B
MGLVCNILGVAGTRVIDSWRQRLVTLVVTPVIPCKALLVVVGFITAVFFGHLAVPIFLSLCLAMFADIVLTSFILRKFVLPGERTGLIMELPPYQKPAWKNVFTYAYAKVKSFYRRGFWFIVIASFLTWAGIYFPGGSIETSYLAALGHKIEPLGKIMGLDWRLFITFLISFLSKEATLGVMAIIFGAAVSNTANVTLISMDKGIWAAVQGNFGAFLASTGITAPSALAFVFAVFFSLPCLGTLAMIYAETRSFKWTTGILCYYFFMSFLMGALAYQAGLLIF